LTFNATPGPLFFNGSSTFRELPYLPVFWVHSHAATGKTFGLQPASICCCCNLTDAATQKRLRVPLTLPSSPV
jgi:hypothetical protein